MTKLLVNPSPYYDESLTGYLLRISLENLISPKTLYSELEISRGLKYYFYYLDTRTISEQDLLILSDLTGCSVSLLLKLKFSIEKNSNNITTCTMGQIPLCAISVGKAKICPICLKDANYYRKHWSMLNVTACKYHEVLLMDYCEYCFEKIEWKKMNIFICKCGHYHKNSTPIKSFKESIDISDYVCSQLYGVDKKSISKNIIFNISDLNSFNITLMFLIKHLNKFEKINHLNGINVSNYSYALYQKEILEILGNQPLGFFNYFERIKSTLESKYTDNIIRDFSKFFNELFHEVTNHKAYEYLRNQFVRYLDSDVERYASIRLINVLNNMIHSKNPTDHKEYKEEYDEKFKSNVVEQALNKKSQ